MRTAARKTVGSRAMAGRTYPQVDPGAAGLVNVAVARVPAGARIADALRAAGSRNAGVVGAGDHRWVLREDLRRAASLGLGRLRAALLARPLPVVGPDEGEVPVRRLLAAGAPVVLVRNRTGPLGAVRSRPRLADDAPALGPRFIERLPEPTRGVLATLARLAAESGARAFLAGGAVRDMLRGETAGRDLDVVVEGDGLTVARAMAAALGVTPGRDLVEHARFLTASLTLSADGRLDITTARAERYETPGALPRVMPATIGTDLARRDFTVNALAVELGSGSFGLLDPFGGRADLARRRLRILHPLSFVEDPTRMFRAARYATRLGLRLDPWTVGARRLAMSLAPYPALSGPRLAAELERILADVHPEQALRELGAAGVYRLLDPRYRFTQRTAARLRTVLPAMIRSRQLGLRVTELELATIALLADQAPAVVVAALERLGLSGEPFARLTRALETQGQVARALERAGRPSERARCLWNRSDLELAWLWLNGQAPVKAAVEWFLGHARGVRPALSGDEVVALGVPRGPQVARALETLRDLRLDDVVRDRDGETAHVQHWITETGGMAWLPSSSS